MATVRDPAAATRTRAVAYELPLYAPTSQWAGTRWLSGGGVSFDGRLLSPARPSALVTWSRRDANVVARTATRLPGTTRSGGLPCGIARQLAPIEDDAAMEGVTAEGLVDQLQTVTLSVDGRPLPGTVLDLSRTGYGWFAEARLDDNFVVEPAGQGVEPAGLALVQVPLDDLEASPHT